MMDRIYRCDVLWEAWRRVKQNRGAAGVDAMTLAAVEQMGVEGFLEDLGAPGWDAYLRTGNAAIKFGQVDDYVAWRLQRLLVKRHGRTLRPGETARWTPDFFQALGLTRLRGTIRYPEAA
jgi:hypothetical protein